uniref:Uncharacterized protein n=1 Tax=Cacopsylla melanoneura TaxID=428564 RepID=A0A8D8Z832_9HEMI
MAIPCGHLLFCEVCTGNFCCMMYADKNVLRCKTCPRCKVVIAMFVCNVCLISRNVILISLEYSVMQRCQKLWNLAGAEGVDVFCDNSNKILELLETNSLPFPI